MSTVRRAGGPALVPPATIQSGGNLGVSLVEKARAATLRFKTVQTTVAGSYGSSRA
jgi:hypothetical protein